MGAKILTKIPQEAEGILSAEALSFVELLSRRFADRIERLLAQRVDRQARFDQGELPELLPPVAEPFLVAPPKSDLVDRRVEITGPVDRKMIINALNSGANVFMADFEDSTAPTFDNAVLGQKNLFDAVRRTISFTDPKTDKHYALNKETATLMVRPRGLHLLEKHMKVDGRPVRASLFDFGLFFFHNARELLARGTGPYFYLPKLESHLEARLWNDIFSLAERELGVEPGSIRATVLIETLPAAFEMDQILFELKEHSAGLNCGRWDYIFSFIKTFKEDANRVLPDRGLVTMNVPFLRAYTQLLIKTCHRRGAHAMGGMAAQIPIKNDQVANETALEKVREDKLREVKDGHDGTWVAHPGLVPVAKEIFDAHMPSPNQLDRKRDDVFVTAQDLVQPYHGPITYDGLAKNVRIGIMYLEAWLRGTGCVPLFNLMEDAATAEISRAQVWQWIRHRARLDDGRMVTRELVGEVVESEVKAMTHKSAPDARFDEARQLFERIATDATLEPFLTTLAYEYLLTH